MKAAILKAFGTPLTIETVPDPVLGTGEVIVDVVATRVLSYANEVLSGERKYVLDLPVIPGPGAIGRVRAFGPDATHLAKGDWVFCDPTVRSRDDVRSPDITLQGLVAAGEGGLRLAKHFHDGSWAEQMRTPTENVKRIAAINEADATAWCALGTLLVPYGGFLAANLQAGETVLVSGATGNFGSSAVTVALAMGAACVVAPGRNEKVLKDLSRRFGERVRTVKLSGDENDDREMMKRAAPGPIEGARRGHDGAAERTGGVDGRCRHGRRSGAGIAVSVADAEQHLDPRRLDVSARGDDPFGRADPVGADKTRPLRGCDVRSRSRQRRRCVCRRQCRAVQDDGDPAVMGGRRHPEVLAVFGEPRRMTARGPSFEARPAGQVHRKARTSRVSAIALIRG